MSLYTFSNNASTTLASSCLSTDTTLTLAAATGSKFPALSAGQIFAATLEDTSGNIEVVYCTGRTGDVLTVTRGQEGTTAAGFASGSRVELRVTAGILAALLQKNGGDTLTGTTTFNGVINAGSSGSYQGGEIAGTAVRGTPGGTGNQIICPTDGTSAPYIGTSSTNVILTNANVTAHLPSGYDLCHTNMIVYWYGTSASVPAGWHVCDGTNGTPDLRDQFVLGGGGALAASGGSSSTTTGSTDPVGGISVTGTALTIAQLPVHTHEFYTSGYTYGSNGPPPILAAGSGGAYATNFPSGGGGPGSSQQIIQNTGSGATHTHTLTGNLAHTHSYTLPPYVAILAIMKL